MMRQLITTLRQRDHEEGSIMPFLVITAAILMGLIGVVIDSAISYHGNEDAHFVASSAARAGTSAIGADAVSMGSSTMDSAKAEQVAMDYLRAAGYEGTVTAQGGEITVRVWSTVETRFISLFGVNTLPVEGEANATLLTQ